MPCGVIVGPVAAAQREQLDHITSSARRLIDVANHVLTLSRIESGRESASLGDVDIAALCREALSLVEGEARAKAIDLDVAITGDVGTRRTDYVRLRQILLNLLSNAVHFTEHGRVSLVVRADREWLRFIVRDTGEGISPDHLDHVFERFWQADPTRARTAHGTGLGLAVARDLARLLGGDIGVESVLGQGSTFTVRLPA